MESELLPEEASLMSLVELQKFLADELAGSGGTHYGRAFRPLTDGLGIAPVAKKEPAPPPAATPRASRPAPRPAAPTPRPTVRPSVPMEPAPPPPERSFSALLAEPKPAPAPVAAPLPEPIPASEVKALPPPVPKATFFRRLLAGLVDQLFVLTVLGMVLLITSLVLSNGTSLAAFGQPAFGRFAALGFSAIWMCYLVVGVGILDMTFGMWVWGLRINYHTAGTDGRFLRKVMRILCSFFLVSPILPALLLAVRVNGRNLLDFLSGSYLYRTNS